MSEHQYFEFLAIERRLDKAAQTSLRRISSRARITSSGFAVLYNHGDFNGDPLRLLASHFDLYLHWANWGSRHFAVRLPAALVDKAKLAAIGNDEILQARRNGSDVILAATLEEMEQDDGHWPGADGETSELAPIAPLRAELLSGGTALYSLLWLLGIEYGWHETDEREPWPVSGPPSAALRALGRFFQIDDDLVDATFGKGVARAPAPRARQEIETWLRALPDDEKLACLLRVHDGEDVKVGTELRKRCAAALVRRITAPMATSRLRTAGELKDAVDRIRAQRTERASRKAARERQLREEQEARERAGRLRALEPREADAWREVDSLIAQRQPKTYDAALSLLRDLQALAKVRGRAARFSTRVAKIAERHARKVQFIGRLTHAGMIDKAEPLRTTA